MQPHLHNRLQAWPLNWLCLKAAIEGLKLIPQINAEVRGHDIVYRNYYDIGIAVGGGKGLVVPVLRNAERLSFAEIERAIADFAERAQANQLAVDECRVVRLRSAMEESTARCFQPRL